MAEGRAGWASRRHGIRAKSARPLCQAVPRAQAPTAVLKEMRSGISFGASEKGHKWPWVKIPYPQ